MISGPYHTVLVDSSFHFTFRFYGAPWGGVFFNSSSWPILHLSALPRKIRGLVHFPSTRINTIPPSVHLVHVLSLWSWCTSSPCLMRVRKPPPWKKVRLRDGLPWVLISHHRDTRHSTLSSLSTRAFSGFDSSSFTPVLFCTLYPLSVFFFFFISYKAV